MNGGGPEEELMNEGWRERLDEYGDEEEDDGVR